MKGLSLGKLRVMLKVMGLGMVEKEVRHVSVKVEEKKVVVQVAGLRSDEEHLRDLELHVLPRLVLVGVRKGF